MVPQGGLENYLQACQRYSQTHFSYPIQVHTVQPGRIFADAEFSVSCVPLEHRVTAFGYRIEERDRTGRFDVKKAEALGRTCRPPLWSTQARRASDAAGWPPTEWSEFLWSPRDWT